MKWKPRWPMSTKLSLSAKVHQVKVLRDDELIPYIVLFCKERVNLSITSVYWLFCRNTRNRLRSCCKLPTEYSLGMCNAQHCPSADGLDTVKSIEVITSRFRELLYYKYCVIAIAREEIPVEESECFQMVHLKRCDLARRSESCRFTKL